MLFHIYISHHTFTQSFITFGGGGGPPVPLPLATIFCLRDIAHHIKYGHCFLSIIYRWILMIYELHNSRNIWSIVFKCLIFLCIEIDYVQLKFRVIKGRREVLTSFEKNIKKNFFKNRQTAWSIWKKSFFSYYKISACAPSLTRRMSNLDSGTSVKK